MANDILGWLKEHPVAEVACVFPDISGAARGKVLSKEQFLANAELRLPQSALLQTVTGEFPDEGVIEPIGAEVLLKPDPDTLRELPWSTASSVQLIYDGYRAGDETPYPLLPRNVLKKVLELYSRQGWRPEIGVEIGFYLVSPNADPDVPLRSPVGRTGRAEFGPHSYAIDATNEFDPLFEQLYDYCDLLGLEVGTLIHEVGAAQVRLNFQHGDPLALADRIFLFKRAAREAAFRHGMYITFMAKPMADQPGSAMHIHHSVFDRRAGQNIFSSGRADGQPSKRFFQFLGGLQAFLPQAMPFLAPYVNSYRRLIDTPTEVSWGYDNRCATLRVPHAQAAQRRIENRMAGADANPYLALAASLACGYLGLARRLPAGEPLAAQVPAKTRGLSHNVMIALDKLRGSEALSELLGRQFVEVYVNMKQKEFAEYFRVISPWERKFLLLHV
jgi:glutamine synthetase